MTEQEKIVVLERENKLLREQIRLQGEIEKMRTENAKLSWPIRTTGIDKSVFGPCFS